ncbi:tRNA (adenosine(37)-N6)-threonylcarbamoyltransferase complex dimerization subunit type 1 TsaB [Paludibacter sp.]
MIYKLNNCNFARLYNYFFRQSMIILHIETSTHVCSVAVSKNNICVFSKIDLKGMNHAALLSVFIQEALDFLKNSDEKLDAVAVSAGPGSYTGLRIGVSTAKGICYGLDIPLISVNTLELMYIAAKEKYTTDKYSYFVPMIDARRMEVYDVIFDCKGNTIRPTQATIVDDNSYSKYDGKICFFGNGSEKCKSILQKENFIFLDNIHPLAEKMINPASKKFINHEFEDAAYYEPFYLKEFQTTIPKNKVLG